MSVRKRSTLVLGVLVLFCVLSLPLFYSKSAALGHYAYENVTDLEASLYGLTQSRIDVGQITLSVYTNEFDKDKETLLMVHGFSADKDVWSRFARHLVTEYNVVIPDLAGHGDTGFMDDWNYSIPSQVNRLIALLDVLNIEKVHVIGNSMGGFAAAYFSKQHPNRTLSAFLIDPAGVIAPKGSDMDNMLAQGKNPFVIHDREEFDAFYAMTMEQPPWLPGFVLGAIGEKYQNRREELVTIFQDFHHKDMLDNQLSQISSPVLLLWGEQDRLLHVSSTDVWQSGVKDITVEIWPGIGHMPMVEVPSRTADRYLEFLSTIN